MASKNRMVNLLSTILWLGLFALALVFKNSNFDFGWIQIALLFILPLFYGMYHFFTSQTRRDLLKQYVISLVMQLVSLGTEGILWYFFLSNDSETLMVIRLYLLMSAMYILAVDVIGFLLKSLVIFIKTKYKSC